MAIGMSYNEYWYGESVLTKYYYKAHMHRIDQRNQEMWVQGLYFASAIESTVGNMFKKKGTKPIKYIEEPIRVTPKTDAELKAEQEKERQKAIESLKRLQKAMQNKDGEN